MGNIANAKWTNLIKGNLWSNSIFLFGGRDNEHIHICLKNSSIEMWRLFYFLVCKGEIQSDIHIYIYIYWKGIILKWFDDRVLNFDNLHTVCVPNALLAFFTRFLHASKSNLQRYKYCFFIWTIDDLNKTALKT